MPSCLYGVALHVLHYETLGDSPAPRCSYSSTYSPLTIFSPCAKMGLEQKTQLPGALLSLGRKIGDVRERSWSIFLPHPHMDREKLGCANPRGFHVVWTLGADQHASRVGGIYSLVWIGNLHLTARARFRGSWWHIHFPWSYFLANNQLCFWCGGV